MTNPIGVFDSGYGGLTVLEELQKNLPEYDYLYLGDNARAPYGTRSFDVVYEYTWECVQELFKRGCDLVVLACNTASAKALRSIQQEKLIDFPKKRVLGVIRPSAEVIGNYSNTKEIGVFATEGTVSSDSYPLEIKRFFPDIRVHQKACPLWVPLVENNEYQTEEGTNFIRKDVDAFFDVHPKVDVLMLGCTHYPILLPILKGIIPDYIRIISQGEIVAASLKSYLERHKWLVKKLSTKQTVTYLTTESNEVFDNSVLQILNKTVRSKHITIK